MKKTLFLIVVVIALAACTTEKNYVITGKIADGDGVTFVLQKRVAGQTILIDSAVVDDGKFVIQGGSVEYPELVQLIPRGKRGGVSFYIENAAINIMAHIDSLQLAVVSGSKTQEEVKGLAASAKPIQDKMMELNGQYREAAQAEEMETAAAIREEIMTLSEELEKLNLEFVKTNTTSLDRKSTRLNSSHT